MRVGRGGSERVKCACSRARAMRVVPILLFSKTGLGMSGVGGAHLCSRPAANSSSICSVTLFVRSSRSSRSSSKHTTKISLHTDKTWFQEWGGYARGEDICGERVCTRQGQTARLLQPRAPSHSPTTTQMPTHIVCAIRAPQPTLHPCAHAPRETRGEYRASLRQSASVEPC